MSGLGVLDKPFYSPQQVKLQERFGTRELADHLRDSYVFGTLTREHQEWIHGADAVFVATLNPQGQPDCSYKGGLPGFISVLDERTIEIPSYDGNGMYRTLGNSEGGSVGLLFLLPELPAKLRIHGIAEVRLDPETLERHVGAEAVITITTTAVFENCPRYLHPTTGRGVSPDCPGQDAIPPTPAWKLKPEYEGLLPPKGGEPK